MLQQTTRTTRNNIRATTPATVRPKSGTMMSRISGKLHNHTSKASAISSEWELNRLSTSTLYSRIIDIVPDA